ncbi:MAG: peptidoglycan DD-metalloendopeptidase family protein [Bdellovibrionales bacterium]|nr:peptidoglycan DD-metalloendopeptidase family protein [Bdellovibrionales bacterium]MBT3526235.1 peptidoglycan DD-metalloendopeptidase family protein [Bdellovibrionales bacterium]MBT7670561.1 peptidoglycan DD-metalloendopeptidase family protein [Bdellovibrionales bacterium]MBT7766434.1 peptidoglycan DD-metalloendopeptidase family protein [Bdellovibrionales bacterium]
MDRFFTVMIIPERSKGVKSFRVPRLLFRALSFFVAISILLLAILSYDYRKILHQVYENKHLTIENRQMKEQIQLFQMKINSLTDDIERIHTFERKLRIITGLKNHDMSAPLYRNSDSENSSEKLDKSRLKERGSGNKKLSPDQSSNDSKNTRTKGIQDDLFADLRLKVDSPQQNDEYGQLKELYEQKIATAFGLQSGYVYTKGWSELVQQSFLQASSYASFDFKYSTLKSAVKTLELDIHQLDQYLLDRDSFLKSTPTLLPTRGWITSYYGPRKSPYSGRVKMHEGIDIGARRGGHVIAPADGLIIQAEKRPGFGRFVQIDHGYGVETIFAHNTALKVKMGDRVKRGMVIATVGSTGYSTGPHVHYEVRVNDIPVDPLYFILD